MNNKIVSKHFILFLLLTITCSKVFCQNVNIDYLGIVSTELDQNMSKMTSDLYFTQLNEIQELSISDKRKDNSMEEIPSPSIFSDKNLSFFAEIKKQENSEKWITIIHVFSPEAQQDKIKTTEYDSFYKILMESKNSLKETIYSLLEKNSDYPSIETSTSPKSSVITSTENLSGTWIGENFIDKIIIMRGGRGFIIFNNGASMNILVEINNSSTEQKIHILQKGRANASFYPNLPRNIAVTAALEAEPIEWNFVLTDLSTLEGTKKALVQHGESFTYATENVKWTKVQ